MFHKADAIRHLMTNVSALLPPLLAKRDAAAATTFVASKAISRKERRSLASLAGIEAAWCDCDQTIPANVDDLSKTIVEELYEPFWFFRRCTLGRSGRSTPRTLFENRMATPALTQGKGGFWTACSGVTAHKWLPSAPRTFDAVVHVVQSASGTGVHVGNGQILTCAHVVDCVRANGRPHRRPLHAPRQRCRPEHL